MVDPDGTEETKRSRPRSGTARNRKKPRREQETNGLIGDVITMDAKDRDLLLQSAFNGDSEAQDEIRKQLNNLDKYDNLNNFLEEAVPVLTRMSMNDHTLKIEGVYDGLAGEAAVGVNLVRDR
ncbi:MAG: hypothetical protein WCK53_12165, partial [Methanomicrobiales archaeon]